MYSPKNSILIFTGWSEKCCNAETKFSSGLLQRKGQNKIKNIKKKMRKNIKLNKLFKFLLFDKKDNK